MTRTLASFPGGSAVAVLTLALGVAGFAAQQQPLEGGRYSLAVPALELLWVEPGTFDLGSAKNEGGDTAPLTHVTLTHGFWLGKTEVTQAQFEAVMGANPSRHRGPDLPVENASWNEAMAFAEKLTGRERAAGRLSAALAYTLPTEAQWEFACRAGTTENIVKDLDAVAWHSNRRTQAVATKQPNTWGFYDQHGNVMEWCFDRKRGYRGGALVEPTGPTDGSANRVLRGANCNSGTKETGYFRRGGAAPDYRSPVVGFRLCLTRLRTK